MRKVPAKEGKPSTNINRFTKNHFPLFALLRVENNFPKGGKQLPLGENQLSF